MRAHDQALNNKFVKKEIFDACQPKLETQQQKNKHQIIPRT